MLMTKEQKTKAIQEWRNIERRKIRANINELKKTNEDLFKMWAYERALDDSFNRKIARENLVRIETLEAEYDTIKTKTPPELV